MYILASDQKSVIDSCYVQRFCLVEKPDASLGHVLPPEIIARGVWLTRRKNYHLQFVLLAVSRDDLDIIPHLARRIVLTAGRLERGLLLGDGVLVILGVALLKLADLRVLSIERIVEALQPLLTEPEALSKCEADRIERLLLGVGDHLDCPQLSLGLLPGEQSET